MRTGLRIIYNCRAYAKWRDPETGRQFRQAKRQGRDSPITQEEARLITQLGIAAVKSLMTQRGLTLAEAAALYRSVTARF